jgi:hypothetical protein
VDATEVRPNPFAEENAREEAERNREAEDDRDDYASTLRNSVPTLDRGIPTEPVRRDAGPPKVLTWAAISCLLVLLGLGAALLLRKGEPATSPEPAASEEPPSAPSAEQAAPAPAKAPRQPNEPRPPAASAARPAENDGDEAGASRSNRQNREATLVLRCNTLAMVRENGKELGMTPLSLTLPAGTHLLELTTPDGRAQTRVSVTLKAGETQTRTVALGAP